MTQSRTIQTLRTQGVSPSVPKAFEVLPRTRALVYCDDGVQYQAPVGFLSLSFSHPRNTESAKKMDNKDSESRFDKYIHIYINKNIIFVFRVLHVSLFSLEKKMSAACRFQWLSQILQFPCSSRVGPMRAAQHIERPATGLW